MPTGENHTEALRVLVVGRFQPLHNGHISLIEQALEIGDVVIAIGSAQKGRAWDNPFTCRERFEMLKSVIREKGWDESRFTIIPVEDIHSNELWVRKVEMLTPEFHIVMSGNPLVEELFSEAGYLVIRPKALRPKVNNGKYIRKKLRERRLPSNLQRRVPASVFKIIQNQKLLTFLRNQNR